MTRTEAIKNLNALNAICGQKDFYDKEFETALEIAINSLRVDEMYQLEKEDADEFIPKSVIEDIISDIQYARESPVGSYDYDNGLDYALRVIDKHCGKEKT